MINELLFSYILTRIIIELIFLGIFFFLSQVAYIPHLWNDLPRHMWTCDSLYQFKTPYNLFIQELFTHEHWRTFEVFKIYLLFWAAFSMFTFITYYYHYKYIF